MIKPGDYAKQEADDAKADATPHEPENAWPRPMSEAVWIGPIGEFVGQVRPQTEADPHALLSQALAFVGNCIGRRASITVEATPHHGNLFVVQIGDTAKARKGVSLGWVRRLMRLVDPDWERTRVQSGLSSGEGLIQAVRDPRFKDDGELVDAGCHDKRLLVIEQELCRPLRAMLRADNTLSAILRDAWDGSTLGILTRKDAITATDAMISLVGHMTIMELRAELTEIQAANGFGNRVLWFAAKRSNVLPFGGRIEDAVIGRLARNIAEAVNAVGDEHLDVVMTDKAEELWCSVYEELSDGKPGLYGAMTARSEAQALRVAMIYALLDKRRRIYPDHLGAGLEIIRYSNDTVRHVFGASTGDMIADRILAALRATPEGMTRWDISRLFSGNAPAERLRTAVTLLETRGLISMTKQKGRGAEAHRFHAAKSATK